MSTNLNETVGFENVGALLEAFQSELEKNGFTSQAEALRGVEVLDLPGAEVALLVLQDVQPSAPDLDIIKRHICSSLTMLLARAAA